MTCGTIKRCLWALWNRQKVLIGVDRTETELHDKCTSNSTVAKVSNPEK